ncbi:MAG: nucleotidyltransferase family protein [Bacillota bacterium]|jgi:GTP:adenosylcobinamide-phosphate guanylyltransferase
MHAIVLAGGSGDQLALSHGMNNKAFLPINDIPMVAYVIDALIKCRSVSTIAVVGPIEELAQVVPAGITLLPDQHDIVDNIVMATQQVPDAEKVMVCTSDIPMITPEIIDGLLQEMETREADLYYPIIRQDVCEARYPGVKRTYARLQDGAFTGGNIFVFRPDELPRLAEIIRRLLAERKNPAKMCLMFGWPGIGLVAKLVRGSLTLAEFEARVSRILGITGAAIVCSYPEVGTDVDKDSDLELARQALRVGS